MFSAPEHATDIIQRPADRAWNTTFQIFQFHFHYRVISINVTVKTQKPQPCYYLDGLMVKLSVFQAVTTACVGSNPARADFFFFFTSRKCCLIVLNYTGGFKSEQDGNQITSASPRLCYCKALFLLTMSFITILHYKFWLVKLLQ